MRCSDRASCAGESNGAEARWARHPSSRECKKPNERLGVNKDEWGLSDRKWVRLSCCVPVDKATGFKKPKRRKDHPTIINHEGMRDRQDDMVGQSRDPGSRLPGGAFEVAALVRNLTNTRAITYVAPIIT